MLIKKKQIQALSSQDADPKAILDQELPSQDQGAFVDEGLLDQLEHLHKQLQEEDSRIEQDRVKLNQSKEELKEKETQLQDLQGQVNQEKEKLLADLVEAKTELAHNLSQIAHLQEELIINNKEFLIDLVTQLSSKLIQHEISQDPQVLKHLIEQALAEIRHNSKEGLLTLKVHPDDYDHAKAYLDQLNIQDNFELKVVKDEEISQGSCYLESKQGSIDLNFASQLSLFKQKILKGN